MKPIVNLSSCAKINLFLRIVGKQEDGYHLLQSFFAPLKLSDVISVYETQEDKHIVLVEGAKIEHNIVTNVLDYFDKEFGLKRALKFIIEKRIPISAGLGGSSTNAAAVIMFLNKYLRLNLSKQALLDIAVKFGADVPYFCEPRPAMVTGIGEIINPVILGINLPVLLVYPGFEISSSACYKIGFAKFRPALPYESIVKEIYNGSNDLEENAVRLYPELAILIQKMKQSSGCIAARLTGSGSAFFGIFKDEAMLLSAQREFAQQFWTYSEILAI